MLTPKQETYYVLEHTDFDVLIQTHFNKPEFYSAPDYEWTNDSAQTGEVWASNAEEGALDYDELQAFLREPDAPVPISWTLLLAELARQGEIPEGLYLIDISW